MDLAKLVVTLEAQSAQYVSELQRANNQLAKFHGDAKAHISSVGSALGELKEGVTAVVEAFAVKEIGEFFNHVIEGAADMRGLSKETGIAVGNLSELSAAAQTKGVDDLGVAMNRLARAARESLDPTSDSAAAFKSIKVSATDAQGHIKPLEQLFLDVADAFSGYKDKAEKSAVSTDLLGKAGFRLIDFMDEGRKGIAEIIESMGGYARLTDESAANSQAFEENLVKLKLTYRALGQEGIAPILPDLIELEGNLLSVEKAIGRLNLVSGPLVIGVRLIRAAFDGVDRVLHVIPAAMDLMSEAEKGLGAVFNAAADGFGSGWDRMEKAAQHGESGISGYFATLIPPDFEKRLSAASDTFKVVWDKMKITAEQAAREIGKDLLDLVLPDDLEKNIEGRMAAIFAGVSSTWDKLKAEVKDKAHSVGGALLELITPPDTVMDSLASGANIFGNAWKRTQAAVHEATYAIGNDLKGISNDVTEFTPDIPKRLKGPEKPDISLITGAQLREQAEAVKQLTKVREQIDDQVASFGLGSVAVMKYSLEFGKLHDVLVKAGLAGKPIEKEILAQAAALEKLKNTDALVQIGAQMNELKGNSEAAAAALFDLQNRALKHNLEDTNDTAGLNRLDHLRELTVAQAKYNDLQTKAGIIQDDLKIKEDAIQRAVDAGSEDELQAQGDLKNARQQAVEDLNNIYERLKAISDTNAKDMPKLVQSTDAFKSSLDDLSSKTNEVADKMRTELVDASSDAWASWIDGEKSASSAFKDFIKSIERDISQLIAKNMFEDLFKPLNSGGSAGGFLGELAALFMGSGAGVDTAAATAASNAAADSMITKTAVSLLDLGGMARGGMVKGQKMYVVGEHGPEIIVPTHAGVVVPNHRAHALVSGLAPRSFASRGASIADSHANMIRISQPKRGTAFIQHSEDRPKRGTAVIHHSEVTHIASVHRALGGPVIQGRAAMVGEYGPELYAPQVNTGQLEANRTTDKSVHVVNNFVLPPGGNVSRATQSQIATSVARSVQIASVRS